MFWDIGYIFNWAVWWFYAFVAVKRQCNLLRWLWCWRWWCRCRSLFSWSRRRRLPISVKLIFTENFRLNANNTLTATKVSSTLSTGGGGARFFFLRLNDIPSVDDDSEDVDPLKLWPMELWDSERGDGSGVTELLQYLYLSMIRCTSNRVSTNNKTKRSSHRKPSVVSNGFFTDLKSWVEEKGNKRLSEMVATCSTVTLYRRACAAHRMK